MEEFTITKEIRSQTKVGARIYAFDFMFLLIYAIICFVFRSLVSETLLVPYAIFSAVMAFTLTSPSPINKQRRVFQSIFIFLAHDYALYRPVKNISRSPHKNENEKIQDQRGEETKEK